MKELAAIVAACLLLFGGIGFVVNQGVRHSCYSKAEKVGYEADYGFFTDCMIKVDGRWIPYDRWINVRELDD